MTRTVLLQRCYPYPPEILWRALTDATLLGRWFMQNDIVPEKGHESTIRMAPQKGWDGITHCKITELYPLQTIAYTYRGKVSGEKPLACAGINSGIADSAAKGIFAELDNVLSFTLTPTGGSTNLTMEHSGFKGVNLIIVSLIMGMGMGWKKQLNKKLPPVLRAIAAEHNKR